MASREVCEAFIPCSHRKSFFFQPLSLLKETIEGYKDNGLLKKYRDFFKSIENLFLRSQTINCKKMANIFGILSKIGNPLIVLS